MGRNRQTVDAMKAELTADPKGIGYKEPDGVTWKSLESLWAIVTAQTQRVPADPLPTWKLLSMIDPDENDVVLGDPLNSKRFGAITNLESCPVGDSAFRQLVIRMCGAASKTVADLTPLATKLVSRFAELGLPVNRRHHLRRALEEL